ncbi:MFS transporter, partial [Kutzneria sp. 744]|uniref:MFS transporter n=1 Tax=Kutzneria sp. (strain 744) TaxID=345341 RepID=UPI0005BA0CC1
MTGHPAIAALRAPGLRRYLAGQLPSVACSWAQVVALSWVVVERDPEALGWLVAWQFAPSLLLGPWFGTLADRHDRKRLLILAETGLGLVALGLVALGYAFAAGAGVLDLPVIYLLAAAWGVINALDTPARRALVPMLVPAEAAAGASALSGSVMLVGMTAGSALGAVLVTTVGVTATFAANAASFFGDALLLATIRVGPSPRIRRAGGQIRDGLRYVWRTPELRAPLLALGVVATLGFTVQVSVPIFVRVSLSGGPALVGAAFTAVTVGSLVGALVATARGEPGPHALTRVAGLMAAALVLTAASTSVPIALVGLAGVGVAWSLFIAFVLAVLQSCEPAMTGRVMSLFAVGLLGGTAAGAPLTATLIALTGPRTALAVSAVATVGAVLLGLALRRPRRMALW